MYQVRISGTNYRDWHCTVGDKSEAHPKLQTMIVPQPAPASLMLGFLIYPWTARPTWPKASFVDASANLLTSKYNMR
jgi:hypothetical protein